MNDRVKENLVGHLKVLAKSFREVNRIWCVEDEIETDEFLGPDYPFKISFDELDLEVAKWVETCVDKLESRPITINVNDDYEGTITKDNVKVGCQNIHIDNIRDLILLHDKHFVKCNHKGGAGTYVDGDDNVRCHKCHDLLPGEQQQTAKEEHCNHECGTYPDGFDYDKRCVDCGKIIKDNS